MVLLLELKFKFYCLEIIRYDLKIIYFILISTIINNILLVYKYNIKNILPSIFLKFESIYHYYYKSLLNTNLLFLP